MRHEPSKGFSFELPDGWHRDKHNLTITFFGPEGRIGSTHQVIELQIGGILPQYHSPEAREKFLIEPGATVHRTVVGGEKNAVVLKKPSNSEISVVRDGIHYSFAHGHDSETLRAIELVKETARFPTRETASSELHRWSDPKAQAVARVLRADSPEEARDILTGAGAPGVRVSGGTLHDLEPKQHPSKAKRQSINLFAILWLICALTLFIIQVPVLLSLLPGYQWTWLSQLDSGAAKILLGVILGAMAYFFLFAVSRVPPLPSYKFLTEAELFNQFSGPTFHLMFAGFISLLEACWFLLWGILQSIGVINSGSFFTSTFGKVVFSSVCTAPFLVMCLHLSETTKKAKELTEVEQGKLFSILYYWSGFIFISLLGALVVILIPFVVRSLFGVVVFCFGFALVIMLVVGMFRASKIES